MFPQEEIERFKNAQKEKTSAKDPGTMNKNKKQTRNIRFEPGVQIVFLEDVKAFEDKNGNVFLIKFFFNDGTPNKIPCTKSFFITGPYGDKNRQFLYEFVQKLYLYDIAPCNTASELVKQLNSKLHNIQCQVVVRIKDIIYKDKNGNMRKGTEEEVWYGAHMSAAGLTVKDQSKLRVPLSEKEMKKLEDHNKALDSAKEDPFANPSANDDIPF